MLLALVVSCLSACSQDGSSVAVRDGPSGSPPSPAAPFRSVRERDAHSDPVRLRVPAIGIDAVVGSLGKLPDGTVDVPADYAAVGWYAEGPRPGEAGPAVLLGHVDSKDGPAVFVRLRHLAPGDAVDVVARDGGTQRFVVERVARYPKDAFPTDDVYLPTLRPELRLVTCGGAFDRATGHYRDNVIAFAVPA